MFFMNHLYHKDNNNTNFLIIACLTPKKGPIFLLKAFKKAQQVNPDIRLDIVGDGSERDEMLQYIKQHDMGKYAIWHGTTVYASEEHKKYLQNADVFIHPSVTDVNGDKEGIPGSIVEAMAAGLPVISTYHAGIPHIISDGKTGLLVKEWDIGALKNAILKIASDSTLRRYLGKNGQEYAKQNLDIKEKEIELEKIYKSLILK